MTYQAITTRYFGPGNVRGARIIATTESGIRHAISYPYELSGEACHRKAAQELADKLGWTGKLIAGGMKQGYAFVLCDAA
jgi:hypothetical protein